MRFFSIISLMWAACAAPTSDLKLTDPGTDEPAIDTDTEATNSDSDTDTESDLTAPPTGFSDPRIFEIDAVNHKVPFGNAPGLHLSDDGTALFAYTTNQRVRVASTDGTTAPAVTELDVFSSGLAIAADDDDAVLLITDQVDRQMRALVSDDFGASWSATVHLGDGGQGPTVPTACAWRDGGEPRFAVAWVMPPTTEDGGPMFLAEYNDGWQTPAQVGAGEAYSAPTLACSDGEQRLVARDSFTPTRIRIMRFERDGSGWSDGEVVIENGADPHFCAAGDDDWIGYHHTGSAYAGHISNGEFETTEVDSSGKFVPIACTEPGIAAVCNGDWDTKEEAESKAPGRRIGCHATFDAGETWIAFSPAPGEEGQSVTSMFMTVNGLAIYWMAPEHLRLAFYDFN